MTTKGDYITCVNLGFGDFMLKNSGYQMRMTFHPNDKKVELGFEAAGSIEEGFLRYEFHPASTFKIAYRLANCLLRQWSSAYDEALEEMAAQKLFDEYSSRYGHTDY